jgi:hypothetical protein
MSNGIRRRGADDQRRRDRGRKPRAFAHLGPRRPDPAAGLLPGRADGQLQPGTHPGTAAACQGRRGIRRPRGHPVHEGPRGFNHAPRRPRRSASPLSPVSATPPTPGATHAASRCGSTPQRETSTSRATTPRCSSCDTRFKFQNFIRSEKRPASSNLLDPTCNGTSGHYRPKPPPGDLAIREPRDPADLEAHQWLSVAHLHVGQPAMGSMRGQIRFQVRPGRRVPHRRRSPAGRRRGRRLPPT